MGNVNERQFIYVRQAVQPREFVEFWAARYYAANEALYTKNIIEPLSEQPLKELFLWKAGNQFFESQWPGINDNFVSKTSSAAQLPTEISARDFLQAFPTGGPIYRIFWLHCWRPDRFPIYDQHVHRAMTYIQDGSWTELDTYSDAQKIDEYLGRYLSFFETLANIALPFDVALDGVRSRKADRALFAFGKSLRTSSLPRLRQS